MISDYGAKLLWLVQLLTLGVFFVYRHSAITIELPPTNPFTQSYNEKIFCFSFQHDYEYIKSHLDTIDSANFLPASDLDDSVSSF